MKKILFIIAMLFCVASQAQTIGYLRYDSVKIAKPGGNAELIIENATKAVTGGVLTNTGNGRSAWVAGGGVVVSDSAWSLTGNSGTTAGTNFLGTTDNVDLVFKRNSVESGRFGASGNLTLGLTGTTSGALGLSGSTSGLISILPQAAAGTYNFNLPQTAGTSGYLLTSAGGGASPMTWTDASTFGVNIYNSDGTLTGARTVNANGNDFYINNAQIIELGAVGGAISNVYSANGASAGIQTSNSSTTRESNINIYDDSIHIEPSLGNIYIDTLQNDVGTHALRYNPTTGLVSYADTTTGGSGFATTALDNLASVAINTSLLPGVSDNIDLGSTTFQWRDLYLGEGQKVDWDNGDVTMTQSGNNLTVAGGAFIVTNAEQTPASFTSTFAGNMQVNWNSSTGNNVNFVFQDAGTARWYVGNNSATGSDRLHILNASAAEAVTVLQGLQVGINQTAPTARLHIGAGAASPGYAPFKLTTGPVLPTKEAGAWGYTTPQLFFTNGRLIEQEIFQGQQSRVSTQYDNATTTLGNVTGLTANVAASGIYRFEAKLYTTSDVAGGIKVAIGGTATATAIRYEGLTTDAGLTTQGRATALGTAVGAVTAVTAAYVVITGTITVNGAGTLTVQAAANAATGTTSVLTGSTFFITEML